jgi:hypothetical protein
MMTPEQISEALKDRRIGMVSAATGLHRNTIQDLRDKKSICPSHNTIRALSEYLEGKSTSTGGGGQ